MHHQDLPARDDDSPVNGPTVWYKFPSLQTSPTEIHVEVNVTKSTTGNY